MRKLLYHSWTQTWLWANTKAKFVSKYALFLFLFFTAFLRADWDQLFSNDEDPSLFHHVNVITGNLNLCLQDTVIEGAKSLPVFRTYSSAGALEPPKLNEILKESRGGWLVQGGWNFLPHTNLLIDVLLTCKSFQIYLPEPSGNLVAYSYSHKASEDVLIFKPEKGFGQCSGFLSAKTNIGNNILELHLKRGEAILFLPNGGSRIYAGQKFHHWNISKLRSMQKKADGKCYYHLVKEVLPSKHIISYSYDDKQRLLHVALMNPSETKTYAWMHLDLIRKHTPFVFGLNTSDRKSFQYKALEFKEVDYICGVQSNCRPHESSGYVKGRKGIGARMTQMDLGGQLQFQASYYLPPNKDKEEKWAFRPEKKHFETDKVRSLTAPIGPNGEMHTLAQFSYHPGLTDVRDGDNHLIRYRHDTGHLVSIEYFNERDEVVSILKFIWGGERLKAKVMLDGQGKAHFSKTFDYDVIGNVTRETLWGAITGAMQGPFPLNQDGSLINAEHYSKRYEYLPRLNIPLVEEEENGLTYRYGYKPQTDLVTAKFTCDGKRILTRELFFYNEDNLLIAEMHDNGTSFEPDDLSQVTERQVKRYDLDPTTGLMRTSTESYFDLASSTEILLRKVVYSYSSENRVVAEAVYDAEDVYRYTIYTDYDSQGHTIRKTTPLGQENTCIFDNFGNVLSAKEVSSPQKIFTYDLAGRPVSVEEVDSFGTIKKTLTKYDVGGRLLSQTDFKGNTTEQEYDAFSRCVRTRFPSALDEEGHPYTPVASFAYDIQGNLSSTAVLGGGVTQTTYNTLRKPIQIVQADGTLIRHIYFLNGTLAKTIYADGTHIDYCYDLLQRTTSKIVYSVDEELLSSENWNYDAFHLLSYTDSNRLTTHYTYDGAGRTLAETAESRTVAYSYDSMGCLEKQVQAEITHVQIHDVGERVIEEWNETADGRVENHMWFSYNDENKKTQAIRLTSQGEATDLFFYDREFRLTRHVDPQENITEFFYNEAEANALGQYVLQKTTIDPIGNQTLETQDALNRLIGRKQKDPTGKIVSEEELFYDKTGNVAKRISHVYQLTVPKSSISVRWEYDAMGRVVMESEENDKTTYFSYDERGQIKTRLLPNGISFEYTYDGINRLLEMKSSDGTIHYHYEYERGSEPVIVHDLAQHFTLKRQYNSFGQLLQETNPFGHTSTWQYDDHGRCISYELPDRSSISYFYKEGHLTEISRLSSYQELLYTHYYHDFDPNGHVSEEKLIHNIGNIHTTHDLLERPILQDSLWFNQTVSYGPSSLVVKTHNSLFEDKEYAYDPLNQLIQEGEEHYAFDSLGNPADCTVNANNQIVEGPGYLLHYDKNGNPLEQISSTGDTIYEYDALGRLISIAHSDSKKTRYFYDPFSRLIAEQTDEDKRIYLYDEEQEIGAMNTQGTLFQLKVVGLGLKGEIGGSVAIEIDGTAYAPLHDLQGNIIALISSSKEIIESYPIDAFGREKMQSRPLNPWRFCSKRETNGLVLFGQRFYDPALRRWLTPDPSGFADGPNLYVYVLNSPLNRLDLFGLNSDPRFPQEMRMEIPLHKIMIARVIPTSGILPCKGFLSEVPVDWVVSCGHWHKLQFTPQEKETGTVNIVDHFHELFPKEGNSIGLITMQNGICTSKEDLGRNVQAVASMVPEGTMLIGMHNPSKGFARDCRRTLKELKGKDTSIVVRTRQFMVAISDVLHKINPNLLWLHLAHSESGAIGGNAVHGMTDEQKAQLKKQLYILALGPAKPLARECGRDVTNVYSRQDFITAWFALKYIGNKKYDIKFVRCKSTLSERTGYFADHAILGGTYKEAQSVHFDQLRNLEGFYNGKTR